MPPEVQSISIAEELDRLKAEIRHIHDDPEGRTTSVAQIKGLRIRVRTFLDEHRRALPREEALKLRQMLQDLDQIIDNARVSDDVHR